jgi:hypothetical protein
MAIVAKWQTRRNFLSNKGVQKCTSYMCEGEYRVDYKSLTWNEWESVVSYTLCRR